jgi:hypothetical protein
MRADEWVRKAERESKLVDALYKARHLISMHNGMTVRCDAEEWAPGSQSDSESPMHPGARQPRDSQIQIRVPKKSRRCGNGQTAEP